MNYIRFLPRPASFRLYQYSSHADTYPAMHLLQNPPGITHPSLPHLCLLVFEAVLEVVCVSLPGYIIARLGHFDTEKQKFLANLNLMLFTPCLSKSRPPHPPPLPIPLSSIRITAIKSPGPCL